MILKLAALRTERKLSRSHSRPTGNRYIYMVSFKFRHGNNECPNIYIIL